MGAGLWQQENAYGTERGRKDAGGALRRPAGKIFRQRMNKDSCAVNILVKYACRCRRVSVATCRAFWRTAGILFQIHRDDAVYGNEQQRLRTHRVVS